MSISCTTKQELLLLDTKPSEINKSYYISEPLNFDSIESLQDYANNLSPARKATNGFISYAETVMQQEDYEERPDAIDSYKFGSLLNADGEVCVCGYFIKLFSLGMLIGEEQQCEIVRSLSHNFNILDLCGTKTHIPMLSPDDYVFEIEGYEGIYLFDLFHKLDGSNDSKPILEEPKTKTMADGLVTYNETLGSLYLISNPYNDFTIPPAGQQKVLFDASHCNDTKIWAKNYLVIYDSGIKIKTMQKGFLGTWSKFQNPMEGGVLSWIVEEDGDFDDVYGANVDITRVNYDSKNALPRNVYTIRYGGNLANIIGLNLQQKMAEGQALADNNNISVTVEGVRFVVSNTKAYTRFPSRVHSENWLTIEEDWPTPFWGEAYSNHSYILNSDKLEGRVYFKTIVGILYGQSFWNSWTKGSKMIYSYN